MKISHSHFHFIGIGGIGMSGLAELLHFLGAKVSGSDLGQNAQTEHLQKLGIKIFQGHGKDQLGDASVVVYSSAVKEDNPEIQEARKRKIPFIPRAEALAEIMRLKRGLAIAGTHGKTTTTSMISSIFLYAKKDPTIMIGGRFERIKSTALLGTGEWMLAEADESDGSFHKLSPEIAIITNIDSDHLDHYKSFSNLQNSFLEFGYRIPFYGHMVVFGDDPLVKKLFKDFAKPITFYGFGEDNDIVLKGERGTYSLFEKDSSGLKKMTDFKLQVSGKHNALNATSAMIAANLTGITWPEVVAGIHQFEGVDRRFQFKGERGGIKIYDDYGHHPTEILATMQAFKEKFPANRIVVYFQPHRYTRTQSCWTEFTKCFSDVDQLFLTDIYAAGEMPIEDVTSEKLSLEIKDISLQYLPKEANYHSMAGKIFPHLKSGDVFITLGAGDGWKLGMEVLESLNGKN